MHFPLWVALTRSIFLWRTTLLSIIPKVLWKPGVRKESRVGSTKLFFSSHSWAAKPVAVPLTSLCLFMWLWKINHWDDCDSFVSLIVRLGLDPCWSIPAQDILWLWVNMKLKGVTKVKPMQYFHIFLFSSSLPPSFPPSFPPWYLTVNGLWADLAWFRD